MAIVLGAVLAGLGLDNLLHSRPLFTLLLVLSSMPLALFLMYRVTVGAIAKMEKPAPDRKGAQSDHDSLP